MNVKEQGLGIRGWGWGMEDSRLEIVENRTGRYTKDKGQRTMDEMRNLKDCFFQERSHGCDENKGDPKKRTRNEAIRRSRDGQEFVAFY